jgi:hypothetical protein
MTFAVLVGNGEVGLKAEGLVVISNCAIEVVAQNEHEHSQVYKGAHE